MSETPLEKVKNELKACKEQAKTRIVKLEEEKAVIVAERDANRKMLEDTRASLDTARKELQETQDEHEGTKKKLKETEEALASAMQKIAHLEAAAALPHGPPTVAAPVQGASVTVTAPAAPVQGASATVAAPATSVPAASAAPVKASVLKMPSYSCPPRVVIQSNDKTTPPCDGSTKPSEAIPSRATAVPQVAAPRASVLKMPSYSCPPRVVNASIQPKVGTNLPPAVGGSLPAGSREAAEGASAVDLDAILKRLAVLEADHTHLVSANAHALKHMVDQTHSKTKTLEDELKSVVQQVRQEVAANTKSLQDEFQSGLQLVRQEVADQTKSLDEFTAKVKLVDNRVEDHDQRICEVEKNTSLLLRATVPAPSPPPGGSASAIEASAPDDGSGGDSP